MGKPKTKDWVQKNFSMSREASEKLVELAKFEEMKETELLEFLIFNWDSGINPEFKLNQLLSKRNNLSSDLGTLDLDIKKVSSQITMFGQWKKQKVLKKANAVEILERLILKKDFDEAERVGKLWQKMTGISSIELLMEAKENVENGGM